MSKIKTIRCPRLTHHLESQIGVEAIVKFDDTQSPESIMCNQYNSERKACELRGGKEYVPCIFAKWAKF